MKISVIVPYEGYYQYLKDCLESLSEQENVEIETLLVGSQDDQKFQQLVDTYKDKISLNVIPCSIEEGVANVYPSSLRYFRFFRWFYQSL